MNDIHIMQRYYKSDYKKNETLNLRDLPSNYKWQPFELSVDRVSTKRITPSHASIIFDKCEDQIIANTLLTMHSTMSTYEAKQ